MTVLITKMLERATWLEMEDPRTAGLLRCAVRSLKELEEQVRERDRQIEDWEVAAQRWVTQIDRLSRKMDELHGRAPGQGALYFLDTSMLPEAEE
jgi:phage shock protein A